MSFLSILATAFGVIGAVSQLPQAIKIFRRKSAKDISILTYIIMAVGGAVWLLYGIEIMSIPIIVGNTLGGVGVIMVIVGWFMYGREKKTKKKKN
jgi:MtN3 and saliva related transmembrane protein